MRTLFLALSLILGSTYVEAAPRVSSEMAVVIDAATGDILYQKNSTAVAPMASITKLMSAWVAVHDPAYHPEDIVQISDLDVDLYKGSSSRLEVGSWWKKEQLLQLSLVASDNRAAHALARTSSYGLPGFVTKMNTSAYSMNLTTLRFVEPTGLLPGNQGSPRDIALLASHVAQHPLLRENSTLKSVSYSFSGKTEIFKNTNAVVRNGWWPSIWLSKTGYTKEAGRCVTMMGKVGKRALSIVLLNSKSSEDRTRDVLAIQSWLGDSLSPDAQASLVKTSYVAPKKKRAAQKAVSKKQKTFRPSVRA